MTPQELQEWIAILGKPTVGVVAVFVLVIYKDFIIHLLKAIVDVVVSWIKRRDNK